MTYPKQVRQQAEELLRRNYSISQVAKELGLQVKTVRRWANELREGKPEPKAKSESTAIVKVDPEKVEQTLTATTEPKLLGFPGNYEKWDATITKKFREAGEEHYKERLLCQSERNKMIAEGTFSSRDANSFSQAITRHIEQEIKMLLMGKSDLPTMTQSYATLRLTGHVVKKAGGENDDIPQSDNIAENPGTNPEEHGIS
ncbi:helix-turn-helix domain-containing protein [Brasilonema sp. CT11]|nr:helix-turn-helix domain-containing protein [Brasilonema sp. CT11]